ncbi:DUF4435 domain-containing protein [Luteibacter sp. 1214]|uniref:DUF4435 domain-containing protein n=1 Tax=Luteibacter sp. 1214 TaxID=2817735 RepID=UPI00286C0832|nr:DUF4435 domain-containing protein [Luteibacter sp. 1214]
MERAPAAKKAKAAMYRAFNDIDIFVEDDTKGTRKLFARLLSGISPDNVRIDTVFPLGSRTVVEKKCAEDQAPGGRPRVYIIDGDIDLCLQRPASGLKRLYRLPRYCIENYLLDERAVAKVLAYESAEMDEAAVSLAIQFDAWMQENSLPLRRLFTAYATCHQLACAERTISYPVDRLVRPGSSGVVDPLLTENRITELRQACDAEFGAGYFDRVFADIEQRHAAKSNRDFLLQFVSAKHYLLRLLRTRMGSVARYTRGNDLMKINLAEQVEARDLLDALDVAFASVSA